MCGMKWIFTCLSALAIALMLISCESTVDESNYESQDEQQLLGPGGTVDDGAGSPPAP